MKITAMESTLYAYGLDRRMGDANSPSGRVKGSGCIVELHTDEGLTGLGLGGGGVRPQICQQHVGRPRNTLHDRFAFIGSGVY